MRCVCDASDQFFHRIGRGQYDIECAALELYLAFAGQVEQIFGAMRKKSNLLEIEKPGYAFDRVKSPENAVDCLYIRRIVLHPQN